MKKLSTLFSALVLVVACSFILVACGGGDGQKTDAVIPNITVQPQDAIYEQGETANPLTVTASVNDGGTLTYKWFVNTEKLYEGGTDLDNYDSSYTPSTEEQGTFYYYVIVSNHRPDASGETTISKNSSIATITVTEPVTVGPLGDFFRAIKNVQGNYTVAVATEDTMGAVSMMYFEVNDAVSYRGLVPMDVFRSNGAVPGNASSFNNIIGLNTADLYSYTLNEDLVWVWEKDVDSINGDKTNAFLTMYNVQNILFQIPFEEYVETGADKYEIDEITLPSGSGEGYFIDVFGVSIEITEDGGIIKFESSEYAVGESPHTVGGYTMTVTFGNATVTTDDLPVVL